jgi:hypothetical protein
MHDSRIRLFVAQLHNVAQHASLHNAPSRRLVSAATATVPMMNPSIE